MLQAVASISIRGIRNIESEAEQGCTYAPVRIANVIQKPVVAVVLIVHWERLHLRSTIGPWHPHPWMQATMQPPHVMRSSYCCCEQKGRSGSREALMQMTALLSTRSMLVICGVWSKSIPTWWAKCKAGSVCEFLGALIPNLTSAGRCSLYLWMESSSSPDAPF